MTESELVHLALAHLDRLTRFAQRLAGDVDGAEDLVQETLLRALKCRDQLKDPTRLLPWMMRILRTRYLEEQRGAERRLHLIEREGDVKEPPAGNLEEELLRGAFSDEVASALEELPEAWRSSVLLCDAEGFSYEEIAEAMDCPLGTVRSRIARARARLIERLSAIAAERGIGRGGRS